MARLNDGWSADQVIRELGLAPLPGEGGYFRETWRSTVAASVPDHVAGTAIYYFLDPASYSAWHCLTTDEVYHFYRGDAVALMQFDPETGRFSETSLGPRLEAGQQCQLVVPAGTWQALRLVPGGRWALMGTTVAPGFEFRDCQLATDELKERFPQYRDAFTLCWPA